MTQAGNGVQWVDVLVIGAGPAGLAAAIAAREDGIDNLLVLEREHTPGGILRQCIHNGFGLHRFKEEFTGPEYAQKDIDRARELNINIQCDTTVLSVEANHRVTCVSAEHGVQIFEAGSIVLAMGCRERPRGALGTPGTRCAGIYSAGTAQKFVNLEGYMPGKRVVILGSGDIGLIMARRMTLQGAKVLACVELMPFSSGLNRNIVQCLNDYDIPLYLSHTVIDIQGKERLTGVTVAEVDERRQPIPGTEIHFDCDTLLLSVGLIPENELSIGAGVQLSPLTQGAVVDDQLQTSVPGIFACGNVLHVHDLVDFVSAESERAGAAAAAYVMAGESSPAPAGTEPGEPIPVCAGEGISYTVPQHLSPAVRTAGAELFFRVRRVTGPAAIVVQDGAGNRVARFARSHLAPGEMEHITLPAALLARALPPLTLRMEEANP